MSSNRKGDNPILISTKAQSFFTPPSHLGIADKKAVKVLPAYLEDETAGRLVKEHKVTVNDQPKIFSEYEVKSNGNCGFTALGVDRQEAVTLLKQIVAASIEKRNAIMDELLQGIDNFKTAFPGEEIDPTAAMPEDIRTKVNGLFNELRISRHYYFSQCEMVRKFLNEKSITLPGGNTDEAIYIAITSNKLPIPLEDAVKDQFLQAHKSCSDKLKEIHCNDIIFNAYVESYNHGLWLGEISMRCIAHEMGRGLVVWATNPSTGELQINYPMIIAKRGETTVHILLKPGHYNFLVEGEAVEEKMTLGKVQAHLASSKMDSVFKSSVSVMTEKMRRFVVSYDDSSDEEVDDKKEKPACVDSSETRLVRFCKELDTTYKTLGIAEEKQPLNLNNDDLLSFVCHYTGIELLYSPAVNDLHKINKKKVLTDEESINKLLRLIHQGVMEQSNRALDSVERLIVEANKNLEIFGVVANDLSQLRDSRQLCCTEFNQALLPLIMRYQEDFIGWFTSKDKYSIQPKISRFLSEVERLYTDIFTKHFHLVLVDKKHQEESKQQLIGFAMIEVEAIRRKYQLGKLPPRERGQNQAVELLKKDGTTLAAIIAKYLLFFKDKRLKVTNLINIVISNSNFQNEILVAYIEFFKGQAKQARAIPPMIHTAVIYYQSITPEVLTGEMLNAFQSNLTATLRDKMLKFPRPILERSVTFINRDYLTFLANLRLANRSQKRQIKNLSFMTYKYDFASRTWQFKNSTPQDKGAVEIQKLLSGSLGRMDEVLGLGRIGNYEDINNVMSTMKSSFSITDQQLATWIRDIVCGRQVRLTTVPIVHREEVLDKLGTISYLLFGCEAVRNPAMLVINQMLLDLISNGTRGWTWEEALTGSVHKVAQWRPKRMPMSPKGAIAAARSLEDKYSKFLPYPYKYPGTDEGALSPRDLVELEGRVVRHWVKLKISVLSQDQMNKLTRKQFAQFLVINIKDSYLSWFGVGSGAKLLVAPEPVRLPKSPALRKNKSSINLSMLFRTPYLSSTSSSSSTADLSSLEDTELNAILSLRVKPRRVLRSRSR